MKGRAAQPLLERVRSVLIAEQLVSRGDRVLVGVSGGADSAALLHLLAALGPSVTIRLVVVHVDHQLRAGSSGDAEAVAALAQALGVPMERITRDVRRETAGRGWSLEDAARRVRYDAFRDAATRHSANRLALAHTADDQAETVLMRLIRGAGLTGLTGIPRSRSFGALTIIRPLLGIWRSELLAYLAHHGVAFCDDPTNRDPAFLRNRIRTQLLPLLEREYNPQMKALCCQLAEQCQVDRAHLQAAAKRCWKRLVKRRGQVFLIRREGLMRQPEAIQRAIIRLAIEQLQGDLTGFEFRHWQEIQRLTNGQPAGSVVTLPGTLQFQRTPEHLVARLADDAPPPLPPSSHHDILLKEHT